MKRRRFPALMKATSGDFNAIHERTEEGIADLIRAIANMNADPGRVVLTNDPVTFTGTGPWSVTIPATYFVVDGVIAQLAETVVAVSGADRDIALFLRIERADVSATRDALVMTQDGPTNGSSSFVVEQDYAAAYIAIDPYTGSGDDPAADTDDVGDPLKLAVLTISGGVMTVDHDPDSAIWVFPTAAAPTSHAATHLPGGGDEIDLATSSDAGLMSAAAMTTVLSSLTNLTVDAASPFLVRTITGDNAPTPKTVALLLRVLPASFVTVIESSLSYLGLNFPAGALAGESNQPARADHKHGLPSSPIQLSSQEITINAPSSQLGSLVQLAAPATFGRVTQVTTYWVPPGVTSPKYPRVETQWTTLIASGSAVKVGTRCTLGGARDVRVRVGDHALCELSSDELALAVAAAGSQTWSSVSGSNGLLPTTGTLVVIISGTRDGVSF